MIFSNGLGCVILKDMRLFFSFLFVLLVVFSFASPILAQQEERVLSAPSDLDDLLFSPKKQKYRPLSDPEPYKDTPQEYLEEVEAFYNKCQSDSRFYQFYNCQCLSVKYLDERIKSGPRRVQNSIVLALQRECKDGAYAAGVEYERCMKNRTLLFARGKTPEEYCACFGNQYAKLYEENNVIPGSYGMVEIASQAHLNCQE